MDVASVQAALRDAGLDGWLLYDFRGSNPIARSLAGVPPQRMTTRRWFLLVPAAGEPVSFVSAIEPGALDVPGRRVVYRGWRDLEHGLREALAGLRRVAMEVSPGAAVPYVSRVDAGTAELVRAAGVELVSSGDLTQLFEARWTPRQAELHRQAARALCGAKDDLFAHLRERLAAGEAVTESQALAFVSERLAEAGLTGDHAGIVAVNDHAASPHFETAAGPDDRVLSPGDTVLVDIWGKVAGEPDAVYADITWMAHCGAEPPELLSEVWDLVAAARDTALDLLRAALAAGRVLHGYEVDRAARAVVEEHGYGEWFVHRLGHSLGVEGHGNGVNLDDLETRDERTLIPGVAVTVEPGVYLPGRLGVRSEVDVLVGPDGAEVTTEIQRALVAL